MIIDPCACGMHPEIKEIKTTVYAAICQCGKHAPAMQIREWAVSEWNRKLEEENPVRQRNAGQLMK